MVTRLTALRTNEKEMTIRAEIEALRSMTVGRLRERYAEVIGEPSRSYNKQFLFRRVAWRIQALAEGGLSNALANVRSKLRTMPIFAFDHRRMRLPTAGHLLRTAPQWSAFGIPPTVGSRCPAACWSATTAESKSW